MKKVFAILNDIRSSHNVGSIFRTADALGVSKIFLVGYTPAPHDRFGRVNKEITKVALGAEQTVAWESVKSFSVLVKKLRGGKNGRAGQGGKTKIIAVEQGPGAIDYKKFKLSAGKSTAGTAVPSAAFVFGNEVTGLSKKVLTACDEIIEIPMRGQKESLNVSVAFGIAMARVLDQ